MNQVIETLLKRRSIRAYLPQQIAGEDLHLILEAGKFAPSAMNAQTWHFTVVQNESVLQKISEANRKVILESGNERMMERAKQPNFSSFHNAPCVIIISGLETRFSPTDCAIAGQNMVIAAESLGIGSCWVASFSIAFDTPARDELLQALSIPEGYKPLFALTFGYPQGEPPMAAPRKENCVNFVI